MKAPALNDRVRFDKRQVDANGDQTGPFEEGFTVWADVEYLRGSEAALTSRLESRQPVSVLIRESIQARTVTPAMRLVLVRSGAAFNITAAAPARQRGYLSILAVGGGADG